LEYAVRLLTLAEEAKAAVKGAGREQ